MATTYNLDDKQLVAELMSGGVGVLPTDTLYGLVCRAVDTEAVTKLYALKNRENKPGTVIAADAQQLKSLGLSGKHINAASVYWPGPISVLLEAGDNLQTLTQSKPELACRVVSGPSQLLNVLSATGPLLTTSANFPGEQVANNLQEAEHYFGQSIDFYVDGGDMSRNTPSTLIRITESGPEVLRAGAGTISTQEEIT